MKNGKGRNSLFSPFITCIRYNLNVKANIIKKIKLRVKGGNMSNVKQLQKLPIGIQTFSSVIEDDYLYVDKTQIVC